MLKIYHFTVNHSSIFWTPTGKMQWRISTGKCTWSKFVSGRFWKAPVPWAVLLTSCASAPATSASAAPHTAMLSAASHQIGQSNECSSSHHKHLVNSARQCANDRWDFKLILGLPPTAVRSSTGPFVTAHSCLPPHDVEFML